MPFVFIVLGVLSFLGAVLDSLSGRATGIQDAVLLAVSAIFLVGAAVLDVLHDIRRQLSPSTTTAAAPAKSASEREAERYRRWW